MTKHLPGLLAIAFGSVLLVRCGNHDPEKTSPTTDTSTNQAAPDNSNATNPSLSDTSYINKDSSKRVEKGDTTRTHR